MLPNITITPFQPNNQSEVKALVLAGLAKHWGTLDPSLNPDLNDISVSYANGIFLVACAQDKIVGTGALLPRTNQIAEIVRMSVLTEMRRQGIGKVILRQLIKQAREAGFHQVILETTATWQEVIEFYKRCGFRITYYHDGDVYFALDLID